MEGKRSYAGQGLGVAGFVLGLIALIISFIPCLGMYALVPGIIALIFSTIAISQATRANASKGLIIAALIISILGTSIAAWQFSIIRHSRRGLDHIGPRFQEQFEGDLGDEIREKIRRAIEGYEDTEFTDTVPVDTLEFDVDDMLKQLEKLEEEKKKNEPVR